ncbi:MAG: hypothetical protein FWC43_12945 [Planctomycetaceae bacterium]|nr:hypothetical protein [Planctomycetaceae bacterium]
MDWDDTGMFEAGRDFRLIKKPLYDFRAVCGTFEKFLQCDFAFEIFIPRDTDSSHAAACKFTYELMVSVLPKTGRLRPFLRQGQQGEVVKIRGGCTLRILRKLRLRLIRSGYGDILTTPTPDPPSDKLILELIRLSALAVKSYHGVIMGWNRGK